MTDGWKKIVRTDYGIHQLDELDGLRIADSTMFLVLFPSGAIMELPTRVRREVVLVDQPPFFKIEERAYFVVPYEGLPGIWLRAIDVEVQPL